MEKQLINRTVTLTMSLEEVAKDFKYNLEVDEQEDVWHNGYSADNMRKTGMNFSKDLENVNRYFPYETSSALEQAERNAYAVAIRAERVQALIDALLKIDLSSVEYTDLDGDRVSSPAGVKDAVVNEQEGTISVTILNPEHLINAMIDGEGMFAADLSSTEESSTEELVQKFHNLEMYFNIYGERKPSGELSSQYSPYIDDKEMETDLKERLANLTVTDVAAAVIDFAEYVDGDEEVEIAEFIKLVPSVNAAAVKEEVKKLLVNRVDELLENIN